MANIFAQYFQRYIDKGYSPIPIVPNAKRPGFMLGQGARGLGNWTRLCGRTANRLEIEEWTALHVTAGIGLALGYNKIVGIDLDYGQGELLEAIEAHIPDSPCVKRGAKGYTAFFRSNEVWDSRIFNMPKPSGELDEQGRPVMESVCEILAKGRQTVIPPTIHPGTGKPYEWDDRGLSEVSITQLPLLPEDFAQRIEEALKPFGYEPPKPRAQRGPRIESDSAAEDMFRETNDRALERLESWVEEIGIDAKPKGQGWRGVATWRGGDGHNVGIHSDGIRDFARDESLTPIDLVMHTLGLDFSGAWDWLRKQIMTPEEAEEERQLNAAADGMHELWLQQQREEREIKEQQDLAEREAAQISVSKEEQEQIADDTMNMIDRISVRTVDVTIDDIHAQTTGFLHDMTEVVMRSQSKPSTALAFSATLGVLSALFGRRWAMDWGYRVTYPNIYVFATAPSGVGKSACMGKAISYYHRAVDRCFEINQERINDQMRYMKKRKAEEENIDEDDEDFNPGLFQVEESQDALRSVISEGVIHSYGGLHGLLLRAPCSLAVIDELGDFTRRVFSARSSAASDDLRSVVKRLVSVADGVLGAEIKADQTARKAPVRNPHLSIMGAGTPDMIFDTIPKWAYKDGTMGRFLLLQEPGYPETQDSPSKEIPDKLLNRMAGVVESRIMSGEMNLGGIGMSDVPIEPIKVPMTPAARATIRGAERWTDDVVRVADKNRRIDAELWSRSIEIASKVALIHALGNNWKEPVVDEQDVVIGLKIAGLSVSHMAVAGLGAAVSMSETESGERADKFLATTADVMRSKGVDVVTLRDINQKFRIPVAQLKETLEQLESEGKLVTEMGLRGQVSVRLTQT